ncbi:TetR/AcrR family transcriptional regulator [Bacteroidota bacterium]
MAPKIVDKELKKQDILDAAIKVFALKGIVKTKMIDIAKEAGIGKGTIYEYFRSKDEIIGESIHAFLNQLDSVNIDPSVSDMDSMQLLLSVIDGWTKILTEDPAEAKVMIDIWAESIRMEEKNKANIMLEVLEKYRQYLKSILDRGIEKGEIRPIDTKSLAALIAATLDGLYVHWIIGKEQVNLEESVEVYKSTLISVLRNE